MSEPTPEPEPELTWAEVYRVNTCGGCQRPDCPACVSNFLAYLRDHGANPHGPGGNKQ